MAGVKDVSKTHGEKRFVELCQYVYTLTLLKRGELEVREVSAEFGVAGGLLELPIRLAAVKLQ